MPSDKILKEKQCAVTQLKDKMQRAVTGIFVDYRGLTVEQDVKLRNQLRQASVDYKVVKNTLTLFAAKELGYGELEPILHGPTSLALSFDDLVAPAKVLCEYAKKNEALEVKAGFVEGRIVSVDEIKELAALPPKEVLIAKVLGGLNAPIAGFANVLNGNLRGLAVALNAIAEKKAAEAV